MNEFEENVYKRIKNELVQSTIERRVDTYFTNRNQLSHYYNVGKMIVDAQGGDERAKYGDQLIKNISQRLSIELNKGYSYRSLNLMRKYYIFQKVHAVHAQLSWMHYRELLSLNDNNEINYYIDISLKEKLSYRQLHKKIKDKEYQRLDDKTKNKLANKETLDIYDNIKNPIYINLYNRKI